MRGALIVKYSNRQINDYILDLERALEKYSVYVWNKQGNFYKHNKPEDYEQMELNFDILPPVNSHNPIALIDDDITLKNGYKYHLTISSELSDSAIIDNIVCLTPKLNAFKLKKRLSQYKSKGYKIIISNDTSTLMYLSAVKTKGFFGKVVEEYKNIEKDCIDLLMDNKLIATIDGSIHRPEISNPK